MWSTVCSQLERACFIIRQAPFILMGVLYVTMYSFPKTSTRRKSLHSRPSVKVYALEAQQVFCCVVMFSCVSMFDVHLNLSMAVLGLVICSDLLRMLDESSSIDPSVCVFGTGWDV